MDDARHGWKCSWFWVSTVAREPLLWLWILPRLLALLRLCFSAYKPKFSFWLSPLTWDVSTNEEMVEICVESTVRRSNTFLDCGSLLGGTCDWNKLQVMRPRKSQLRFFNFGILELIDLRFGRGIDFRFGTGIDFRVGTAIEGILSEIDSNEERVLAKMLRHQESQTLNHFIYIEFPTHFSNNPLSRRILRFVDSINNSQIIVFNHFVSTQATPYEQDVVHR